MTKQQRRNRRRAAALLGWKRIRERRARRRAAALLGWKRIRGRRTAEARLKWRTVFDWRRWAAKPEEPFIFSMPDPAIAYINARLDRVYRQSRAEWLSSIVARVVSDDPEARAPAVPIRFSFGSDRADWWEFFFDGARVALYAALPQPKQKKGAPRKKVSPPGAYVLRYARIHSQHRHKKKNVLCRSGRARATRAT